MCHGESWLRRQKVELQDVLCMCMRNSRHLPGNGDKSCFSCNNFCTLRLLLFSMFSIKYE